MKNKIIIISIYSTPFGMAPTNRILSYAKGLKFCGHEVKILNPFPTDYQNMNNILPNCGLFQGIEYQYCSGRYLFKNRILRVTYRIFGIRRIVGYISSLIYLKEEFKHQKIQSIIISSDLILNLFFYSIIAKIFKIKSVFIFDEYPIPIRHKLKSRIPKYKTLLYKFVLKFVDGYISISKNLADYYNQLCIKPYHVMPLIIDVSRFSISRVDITKENPYLCYMGNMELAKDDVLNIIDSFSLICKNYPKLKLHLYGLPNHSNLEAVLNRIKSLELEDIILFMGSVEAKLVPEILINAKILVSSQPNTLRASGGFPTKLGEYLASGVPTLMVNVGENSKYVSDNVHLFFVPPCDPKKYSEKISYILNNYDSAKQIAENGRKYVNENYSHIIQGNKLSEFLSKL